MQESMVGITSDGGGNGNTVVYLGINVSSISGCYG